MRSIFSKTPLESFIVHIAYVTIGLIAEFIIL
jgi:hypothetical protein